MKIQLRTEPKICDFDLIQVLLIDDEYILYIFFNLTWLDVAMNDAK